MALPLFYPADCLPAKKEETDLKRWHTDPAGQWGGNLTYRNGSLGAMAYGSTDTEIIKLNHDEFWPAIRET